MVKNKLTNVIMVAFGFIEIAVFLILYLIDPYAGNNKIRVLDVFILIFIALVNAFIPKLRLYCYFALIGYVLYLIIQYFI